MGGFSGLIGYELIAPTAELSREDGVCRIGIRPPAAISVMVLDTAINVVLTGVFIWQLWPAITSISSRTSHFMQDAGRKRNLKGIIGKLFHTKDTTSLERRSSRGNLRKMLIRNVAGSSLLLLCTIANNVIFLQFSFAKMAHACLLMCLSDGKF